MHNRSSVNWDDLRFVLATYRARTLSGAATELGHVAAGREGLALAAPDHAAYVVALVELAQALPQTEVHLVVRGVVLLGAVVGEDCNRAVVVQQDGITAVEIGYTLDIEKSTLSRNLKRLIALGLIEMDPPAGRRGRGLHLTPK